MKGTNLGEFEELVLLTIASLDNEVYAIPLKEELERVSYRKVNISAVHAVVYRLEQKGFISSFFGDATKKRGGKRKRYFQVSTEGFVALEDTQSLRLKLWKKIPQLSNF